MSPLVLRDVEVDGRNVDVLVRDGRIALVHPGVEVPATAEVVDGHGGTLLPGLHDHHVHLLASAARETSLALGPPAVRTPADLDRVIRDAHRRAGDGAWLRAVGHDDGVGGALDRHRLDALAPGRPVRVQHRSGALWVLSSTAMEALPAHPRPEGVEIGGDGEPTGRLWRLDRWLREHLPAGALPDPAPFGARLAARGVTGVTDATPSVDPDDFTVLAGAVRTGALPLRVTATGGVELRDVEPPAPLARGPVKLVVADHAAPDPDAVAADIERAHAANRAVAVHCVTATAAAVAIAAWRAAGTAPGDRMEHGSVLVAAAVDELARLGITVVTQPAFVHDHGDRYGRDVEPVDQPHLYRCRSLLDAGVAVGGSSDAPYGDADPWRAIASATDRRTAAGRVLGAGEAIPARRALELYLTAPDRPGGPPRRVAAGADADLCLLTEPLDVVLREPARAEVAATLVAGRVTHRASR